MSRRLPLARSVMFVALVALTSTLLVVAPAAPARAAPAGDLPHWSETNGGTSRDQEYTRSQAVAVAHRYDMVSALRWTFRQHADAMRAANPDFKLMMYQNGAFARYDEGSMWPRSWYLRDRNGKRIRSVRWGNYLMDPANRGWQDQVAAECRRYVEFGDGDGCHLDDLGWGNHISDNLSGTAINPATGRRYTESQWLSAAAALARRVSRALPDRMLVGGNGLNHGNRWFGPNGGSRRVAAAMDYGVAEGFLRGESTPVNKFRREEVWKRDVDMLVDAGRRGLRVATMTKIWKPASRSQVARWRLYALASFLLGTNGDQYFFFNPEGPGKPPAPHPWDRLDLGAAKGSYARSNGVYHRTFARGRVYVNPTTRSRTVDLGRRSTTIHGTEVRRFTLGPNRGMIIIDRSARVPRPTFRDVPVGSTFADDIRDLAAAGITKGCNPPRNDRFCPGRHVTRQEMAAFLTRALDLRAAPERFRDVSGSDTFAADIGALARAGITRGCNPPANTRFCPDRKVTRKEMAAFLSRGLRLRAAPERFRDVSGADPFAADIGALARAGITRGCNPPTNSRFCPNGYVTREQMAAFIVRAGLTD